MYVGKLGKVLSLSDSNMLEGREEAEYKQNSAGKKGFLRKRKNI